MLSKIINLSDVCRISDNNGLRNQSIRALLASGRFTEIKVRCIGPRLVEPLDTIFIRFIVKNEKKNIRLENIEFYDLKQQQPKNIRLDGNIIIEFDFPV